MVRQQNLKGGLTRREILKHGLYGGLAAGLAPSLWLSGCGKRQQGKRPNIILIVIDTLRADHVACYGYQRNTTPNIDRLAREGVLFKNAISAAPWTQASIATILTSQYPCVLGIHQKPALIDSRFLTLSQVLKQYNYTTHGVYTAGGLSPRLGLGRGFDNYCDLRSPRYGAGITSPNVTKEALSFLGKSHKEPFFLFLHYFDPHYNYILHKQYNYYPNYRGRVKRNHSILDLWRKLDELSEDDVRYLLALYDSEITFTDEYIRKLLDELKKQGLYEDSVIIVTADHGEAGSAIQ
ncbi:Ulvan-active sulfatase [subsurface metagenome]